ncbi:MAG: hypothetical protein ACYST2_04895, partial [Planctomycetota bacterium]
MNRQAIIDHILTIAFASIILLLLFFPLFLSVNYHKKLAVEGNVVLQDGGQRYEYPQKYWLTTFQGIVVSLLTLIIMILWCVFWLRKQKPFVLWRWITAVIFCWLLTNGA